MQPKLDVLCVADTCVDLILRGNVRPHFKQVEQLIDSYELELGGSACIFASQFAKLGGRSGVLGRAGDDAFGRLVLEKLKQCGVDARRVSVDRALKTGLGVALAEPADRAILTYLGTIDCIGPDDLADELLSATRHWHIASYFLLTRLREYWPNWIARLRENGVTVSLDTNWDPSGGWDGVVELLPLIDVFLPNEAEACAIAGVADVSAAGRSLSARGPLVVIKRGSNGAVAFAEGREERVSVPDGIRASLKAIDSIGAGDSFDGGFLRAWQLGLPLEKCLNWGVRCGCASLGAAGGIAAQMETHLGG